MTTSRSQELAISIAAQALLPMRVLIADDDSTSRLLLSRALVKWGYDVTSASEGLEALGILESDTPPSLVILDWMMPGMDGPEICRRIRARDTASEGYTYVLMLTSRSENADVVGGLTAGADDYVVKPFELPELEARLRAGQRILTLEAKLRTERAAYLRRAQYDGLTGIWNRRTVLEALDRELHRSRREQRCLAVVMLDLDNFKGVNDTHGHPVGDEVLVETSRRLRSALRPYDAIGRLGGEEFLAVLSCRDHAQGAELAERLRIAISSPPLLTSVGPYPITVSVGVATTDTEGYSAEVLLVSVDHALYQAKRNGRNRVEVAGTSETAVAGATARVPPAQPQRVRSGGQME